MSYYIKHQEARHLRKLKKQARLLGFDLIPTVSTQPHPKGGNNMPSPKT